MMKFYTNVSMRGSRIYDCPDLADVIYQPNHDYHAGDVFAHKNKLYIVNQDFTSSSTKSSIDDNFNADLSALKLRSTSVDGVVVTPYVQGRFYSQDTLVYFGDQFGRVAANFTSDTLKPSEDEAYSYDVGQGNIIPSKISIDELDDQLLKALPVIAFIGKQYIPRFSRGIQVKGTDPTFRDGTPLTTEEKYQTNFLYVIDDNGELTGLALVLDYDETSDVFTLNAMEYGVGTQDDILPTHEILTKRDVGSIEIISKDDLLGPKLVVRSSPPYNVSLPWFPSNRMDADDISIGPVNVIRYNEATSAWDIPDVIDIKDSEVVKNGNGTEWQYYRIQSKGHVTVSLADWQLVYDTNQILGKILNVDTSTHQVTIRIIHACSEEGSTLAEDVESTVAIGAAPAGFVFPQGMTFTDFLKKVAIKDILATLNFNITNGGLKKKGTIIDKSTLTATISAVGNVPIKDLTFYVGNTVIDTLPYAEGTSTYTVEYNHTIITDTTFSVVVNHEKDQIVRKALSITFVNPSYFGTVDSMSPTDSAILALTEIVKSSKQGNYMQSIADSRTCYAYPASMGDLMHIRDSNDFEYIDSFTKQTMTFNGETYNVYILTDPVTASDFTWKFE